MYLELVKLLSLEIKALLSFSFLLQYRELNETFLDRRMTQETVHRLGNKALRVSSMIWTKGENNLRTFLNYINSIHPTIKFTHEYSDSPSQTLPFLDVQVHLNNNQIQTDLHTKPTDKHQYLFKTSCHPTHTKFTHEYSNSPTQTLPFQDVQVHLNNSTNALENIAAHYKITINSSALLLFPHILTSLTTPSTIFFSFPWNVYIHYTRGYR